MHPSIHDLVMLRHDLYTKEQQYQQAVIASISVCMDHEHLLSSTKLTEKKKNLSNVFADVKILYVFHFYRPANFACSSTGLLIKFQMREQLRCFNFVRYILEFHVILT